MKMVNYYLPNQPTKLISLTVVQKVTIKRGEQKKEHIRLFNNCHIYLTNIISIFFPSSFPQLKKKCLCLLLQT